MPIPVEPHERHLLPFHTTLLRRSGKVGTIEGCLDLPLLPAPISPTPLLVHLGPRGDAINGKIHQLPGTGNIGHNPVEVVADVAKDLLLGDSDASGTHRTFNRTSIQLRGLSDSSTVASFFSSYCRSIVILILPGIVVGAAVDNTIHVDVKPIEVRAQVALGVMIVCVVVRSRIR